MILPKNLIGWLVDKGMWPGSEVSEEERARYWENARKHNQAWARKVCNRTHPLYIWGDDAQYDEKGSKLVVILVGHCLDEQTDSRLSCFPLACLRCDSCWQLIVLFWK